MKFIQVAPYQIDYQDRLFYVENEHTLELKDKKVSTIFNPIWLQAVKPDRYRIVDGFLLFEPIVRDKQMVEIPARIFSADTPLFEVWLLRIAKRQAEKNLMPLALLESLQKLLSVTVIETPPIEIVTALTAFGIPVSLLRLETLNRVTALLQTHCRFCDLYALTYREIESLSRRNERDLQSLSILFSDLNLKGNKLQSLMQIMDELEKGYQLSPQAVMEKTETRMLLDQCPIHMKYKTLKSYLMSLRWPVLDKTQKKWHQSVKKLTIPGKLEITTDPWFESNEIEFILKASSLAECRDLIVKLDRTSQSKEFGQLFDFI